MHNPPKSFNIIALALGIFAVGIFFAGIFAERNFAPKRFFAVSICAERILCWKLRWCLTCRLLVKYMITNWFSHRTVFPFQSHKINMIKYSNKKIWMCSAAYCRQCDENENIFCWVFQLMHYPKLSENKNKNKNNI